MYHHIFRNRYIALLWAALICWQAAAFVGDGGAKPPVKSEARD